MHEEIREFLRTLRTTVSQLDILMAAELDKNESELILKSIKTLQSTVNKHIGEKAIE